MSETSGEKWKYEQDDNRINPGLEYKKNLTVNRSSKDSVFTDLFSDPEYLLELYKSLFPEDTGCTKEDFELLSLGNVFVNGAYNDLGFLVKNKILILVEAQSTWNPNIPMRMLSYVTYTYREYETQHKLNNYGVKLEKYPRPELYVVYTGTSPVNSKKLRLSDCFIGESFSEEIVLDCIVNVIDSTNSSGILTQYISFCKIFNDMIKEHGYVLDAVRETIRICKDKDILKKYLESREVEVTRMLANIFNQEVELDKFIRAVENEHRETQAKLADKINDAQNKLDDIQNKLDDTQNKLDDTQNKLDDTQNKLDEGIKNVVSLCFDMKLSREETILRIEKAFCLSHEESQKRVSDCEKNLK